LNPSCSSPVGFGVSGADGVLDTDSELASSACVESGFDALAC
jgi:hypothetical protein